MTRPSPDPSIDRPDARRNGRVRARRAAALFLALLLGVACEERPKPSVAAFPAPRTYATRGRIVELPSGEPGTPARRPLAIHHEKLDSFVDRTGKDVGMRAMTMPFPWVDPGVSLEGLGEGDGVELEFLVDWSKDQHYVVTRLKKIPR